MFSRSELFFLFEMNILANVVFLWQRTSILVRNSLLISSFVKRDSFFFCHKNNML